MLCLEARPIAYRAGESGRQERASSGLRLQAHSPLPEEQQCSPRSGYLVVGSIASVLSSFGNIMSVSFCGSVSGCRPRPCAHRIQSILGTESGYVVRPYLSGWYITVAIVIGSIRTFNPLKTKPGNETSARVARREADTLSLWTWIWDDVQVPEINVAIATILPPLGTAFLITEPVHRKWG